MAQLSSLTTEISSSDQSGERIGKLAGFGSIFGVIAAVFGILIGKALVPIASIEWEQTSISPFEWIIGGDPLYHIYSGIFMGLLAAGLLFQAIGSKGLSNYLGSGYLNILWVGFFVAGATAFFVTTQFGTVFAVALIEDFLIPLFGLGAIFVIIWQLGAIIYTDSSKTWIGCFAGIFNALFIPVLAIGQAISPLLIYTAYGLLLLGQLMSLFFWWSPFDTIREYARSPSKAKFAFGLSGVITFVLGFASVFIGPISTEDSVAIWHPWSTLVNETTYLTNPSLVYGFVALMLYWIMLAPRLGARELKAAAIGEDIIKGGTKWFMLLLAMIGLFSAGQAGAGLGGVGVWGFFLVIAPAGVMFLMGASYTIKTDIITGLPLVVTSVFLMVHPFVLLNLVLYPWILIIITQIFLVVESLLRGLTGFSQAALTVIISLATSISIIIIMLGGFGSGPLVLWPTNRWFNITLIPGIAAAIQKPTIIILPLLILLIRNVSLAGYAYGRGYASGGILVGVSMMFAFMIPVIAGNESVPHEANTGAALLLALYSISVILIMSVNLSLSNDVEEKGHGFEGSLIRASTMAGIIAAGVVVILTLIVFAGMPAPSEIALMVSIMVTFVVGTEILSSVGWFISGVRLGMLKKGFSFSRLE